MSARSPKAQIPALSLTALHSAAALDVSFDYFTKHVAPELRAVRKGRKRLYLVTDLEKWLAANASVALEAERR